jgi:hypothetical protein
VLGLQACFTTHAWTVLALRMTVCLDMP